MGTPQVYRTGRDLGGLTTGFIGGAGGMSGATHC